MRRGTVTSNAHGKAWKFFFFIFIALLAPHNANATITILPPGNASGFLTTTSPATIYGGIAGAKLNPTQPTVPGGLIDTCANPPTGTNLFACNNAAIYPSAVLYLNFSSDSTDGVPSITYTPAGTSTPQSITTTGVVPPSITHPGTATVATTWGVICQIMSQEDQGVNSDCSLTTPGTAATFTFTATITGNGTTAVGSTPAPGTSAGTDQGTFNITVIDGDPLADPSTGASTAPACDPVTPSNDVGVCHFEMVPGDSSAEIQTLYSAATFPNLYSSVPITGIMVLWAPGQNTFANIIPPSPLTGSNYQLLTVAPDSVSGSISLSPQIVSGLNNNTYYSFKIALVDAAGNIGFYTASDETTPGQPPGSDYSCIFTSNPQGTSCHMAEPGAVEGVLSQDINCFIATAAYGSHMAPEVRTLREFRNRFMIPSKIGRKLVRFYYKYSPYYARIIARHDVLRSAARGLLWPLIGFAKLALRAGAISALSILAGIILLMVFAIRFSLRKSRGARV